LFGGAVSKDTVSRVWRKVQTDWDAWNTRSLKDEPVVRLILDGTLVRVRLDKKATAISLLVVIGVRDDGQKLLLAVKQMGGETTEAWRAVLDDLTKRGLRSSVRDRRRRRGPRECARGSVERRACAALYRGAVEKAARAAVGCGSGRKAGNESSIRFFIDCTGSNGQSSTPISKERQLPDA
jgi:Transposase, Mutator family